MSAGPVLAFGPGRANLIGEHTDYNDGLSLPFAVAQGVRVRAEANGSAELEVEALDHGERERFAVPGGEPGRSGDWRDFVRGAVAELDAAGVSVLGGQVRIEGDVPEGSGLSSSAALETALCLALIALSGAPDPEDRVELARLCSRIENRWVGARTGLLDQLASLLGVRGHALCIDFRSLEVRRVPMRLSGWRLAVVDSGEHHVHASSGYNERRAECERARELLGLGSLRDARLEQLDALPDPLDRRVRHVIEENERVEAAVRALQEGKIDSLGLLLDASHRSLRDLYDASTEAVERTVRALHEGGAAGARMMGGGFGGAVLGLFPAGVDIPAGATEAAPGDGARLLEGSWRS